MRVTGATRAALAALAASAGHRAVGAVAASAVGVLFWAEGGQPHVLEPITFVLKVPEALANATLLLDAGDGSPAVALRRGLSSLGANASEWHLTPEGTLQHTYEVAGDVDVTVSAARKDVGNGAGDGLGDDADVVVVGRTRLRVREARWGCVRIQVQSRATLLPGQSATVRLTASMVRAKGLAASSWLSGQQLSRELITVGEQPMVQVGGDPALSAVTLLESVQGNLHSTSALSGWALARVTSEGDAWEVDVQANEWPGTAWLSLQSLSDTALAGDCGIAPAMLPLAVSRLAALDASGRSVLPPYLHIEPGTGAAVTTMVAVARVVCAPSSGVALLRLPDGATELAVTTDAFRSYARISMPSGLRVGRGLDATGTPLEDNAQARAEHALASAQVRELVMVSDAAVLLVTDQGLFVVVLDLLAAYPLVTEPGVSWKVSAPGQCTGEPGLEAVLARDDASMKEGAFLVAVSTGQALHVRGKLRLGAPAGKDLQQEPLPAATELFRVREVHDYAKFFDVAGRRLTAITAATMPKRVVMLLADAEGHGAFVGSVCEEILASSPPVAQIPGDEAAHSDLDEESSGNEAGLQARQTELDRINACWVSLHGKLRPRPRLGFRFPRDAVLLGICKHATGLGLFAFGDALWLSGDSGTHFNLEMALEPGERIESCPISSATHAMYIVHTSFGRVLYGKVHIQGGGVLLEGLSLRSAVSIDSSNEVFALDPLEADNAAQLHRLPLPLPALLETRRWGGEGQLLAADTVSGTRLALWCTRQEQREEEEETVGGRPARCLLPQHKGMLVMPLGVRLHDLDMSTGVAFAAPTASTARFWDELLAAGRLVQPHESCTLSLATPADLDDDELCHVLSSPELAVNVSCASSAHEDEVWAALADAEGALLEVAVVAGQVQLIVGAGGATARCVFGPLQQQQSNMRFGPGTWQLTDTRGRWWLEAAPCAREAFDTVPALASPVVRLLDKFDMFLWRSVLSSELAAKTRSMERATGLSWGAAGETQPAQVTRSNPGMTTVHTQQFMSADLWGSGWSLSSHKTAFYTYQRVSPDRSQLLRLDDNTFGVKNVLVYVEPTGNELGLTTLLMEANSASVTCRPELDGGVARLQVLCPFYKKLEYVDQAGARGSMMELPANYRPPSYRGKGIPLTPNVYHADPSQPLFMNWYTVSRESARFKQCQNATVRSECACTAEMEASRRAEHSDCITHVRSWLFNDIFTPEFVIQNSRDGGRVPLRSMYNIRDLNNRTDFCRHSATTGITECGETGTEAVFALDAVARDSVLFVGEGLYHFEVTVLDPISFCDLKSYIMLFVEEPPLSTRNESITISVTAVTVLLSSLVAYLAYFYWNHYYKPDHQYSHVGGDES